MIFISLVTMTFPFVIIWKFFKIRKQNKSKHKAEHVTEPEWEHGDAWQTDQTTELTGWKEIMTIPQDYYRTHLYDFGSEIMRNKNIDLDKIQGFLSEHQIESKVVLSQKSTLPADGLFVEEKNYARADEIIRAQIQKERTEP